jgi:hypothetical protein
MKTTQPNMPTHTVELIADSGLFRGLANQNMLFHQCIIELVDNCIAQRQQNKEFRIDIIFSKKQNSPNFFVYVVDNCKGMSAETLGKAMQPGESATTNDRLNEHGFGLKHSLATLSKHSGHWKIWSKDLAHGNISSVKSPFQHKMIIDDADTLPALPYHISEISTVVQAEVTLKYVQTVQISRGAKAENINTLIDWLIEHLGVTYRGYLVQDPENNYNPHGAIYVSLEDKTNKVPPIEIPMILNEDFPITMEIDGRNVEIIYRTGLIDERKRKMLMNGKGLRSYYLQNRETQGIDIRIGKRVIATKQLNSIWGKVPHNKYNIFAGELILPEMPRNVLRTVNNKTDIDFDDPEWVKIFDYLREKHELKEDPREAEEEDLRTQWIKKIRDTNPDDKVLPDVHVWFNGVRIDVYREIAKGNSIEIIIYELKAVEGRPLDLYQLKMYWDGLVINNHNSPKEAWLICESPSDKLQDMADRMNLMTPQKNSNPYKFIIKTIEEVGLRKNNKKK